MKPINVFIADDHEIVRTGLTELLNNYVGDFSINIVGSASNVDELTKNAKRKNIDIFITDLGFEGTKGDVGIIQKILDINRKAKIVVFSMRNKTPTIIGCYRLGAKGYVSKSADSGLILDAIQTVHSGEKYFMPGVLEKVGLSSLYDPLEKLDDREKTIFLSLAQNIDISDVAQELNISEKTIQNIITQKIKPVLGVSRSGFRDCAIRMGLIDDF
ncbi:response regulator transcription factor [Endozoicomonas sp. SM1973]|uniref:Response regulator transcription factor n=1 Tax=Spartinivicinus marinus TaxID=2994442 RepID=A0A853IGH3_9GAMM|nr:response regulator transcription factor [Spartinivicinus marinus]MCX4030437.1 response regulator transcription factor [Spartinivicinus marinus]NYZ69638.1 response regulator transcription factor [Spartinivicinus marinus]